MPISLAANSFIELMEKADVIVRVDAAGNIFADKAGREASLPPVLFGSHIDSIPNGGNFDGTSVHLLRCIFCKRCTKAAFKRGGLTAVIWGVRGSYIRRRRMGIPGSNAKRPHRAFEPQETAREGGFRGHPNTSGDPNGVPEDSSCTRSGILGLNEVCAAHGSLDSCLLGRTAT